MVATINQQLERLYLESNMEHPELLNFLSGRVAAICRRCPGRTEPNDDCAAVIQVRSGGLVLAVADGVGGCASGYKASSIAVQSIAEHVRNVETSSALRPAILDGIEHANREVLDLGIGAATTVSVVEIQDRVARAYQVGDSTTLVVGQRGALKWKSTSHSPVGYALESGLLDEEAAMHHDERHVVSNLVGSRTMHIEIGPSQPLAARDTVIVGSDGLFDNLHLDEVIRYGRVGHPLQRMTTLAGLAAQRMSESDQTQPGKPDDLTILLYTA